MLSIDITSRNKNRDGAIYGDKKVKKKLQKWKQKIDIFIGMRNPFKPILNK